MPFAQPLEEACLHLQKLSGILIGVVGRFEGTDIFAALSFNPEVYFDFGFLTSGSRHSAYKFCTFCKHY